MQKLMEVSSQEGATSMTKAKIVKQVLGHRASHTKGLGSNPGPSYKDMSSSQYEKELEKKLEKMGKMKW